MGKDSVPLGNRWQVSPSASDKALHETRVVKERNDGHEPIFFDPSSLLIEDVHSIERFNRRFN